MGEEELKKEIEGLKLKLEELQRKDKLKPIADSDRQFIHRLAVHHVTFGEPALISFIPMFKWLRKSVGEEVLIEYFGADKMKDIYKRLEIAFEKIEELKSTYDLVRDKDFNIENFASKDFLRYVNNMKVVHDDVLYDAIFELKRHSEINNLAAPKEAFLPQQVRKNKNYGELNDY